ncbi:cell wall metabolism sensor histidine kinase WalK [Pseudoroseomonas cervicalis]|uniref:sensor histidine kinase n=1 Tax=Teichococcus cervicalis TaxID=204525 RepID=UPI00278AE701|nr:HAMP domain-containing sensor histidine kinase [Pseudoroseomonas cervicalis]MDQ1081622.1 signal transduction histidine kinase [Pseudoroseomonas cervicalis]
MRGRAALGAGAARIAWLSCWLGDTLARRFAMTILLAFAATLGMNLLFVNFAGVWGRPSVPETGLLHGAAAAVRIIEALPPDSRPQAAAAAATPEYRLAWYPGDTPLPLTERLRRNFWQARPMLRALLGDERNIIFFDSDSEEMAGARFDVGPPAEDKTYFMGVQLADRSWLMFTVPEWRWGPTPWLRKVVRFLFALASVLLLATLTARSLAGPIERLAAAVRRFGTDPQAPPIPPTGPAELRQTIEAFNAMQARIGRFVQDRTVMLAAISHDLRTPLTRMRLIAEFVEEPQQGRLFRNVDEMQGMVDSALAFFRDDAGQEPFTRFDLPELLKSIIDDYGDQGIAIPYAGPDHGPHHGRPHALRRAFVNLVENAVKYATPPEILLRLEAGRAEILVRDAGPGLPQEALEQVFAPYYRMESSRNRASGGVGLGLTSARSIIRAHGGEVRLANRPGGGLEVHVTLPAQPETLPPG